MPQLHPGNRLSHPNLFTYPLFHSLLSIFACIIIFLTAAKEREKTLKLAQVQRIAAGSNASSKVSKKAASTGIRAPPSGNTVVDQQQMDMSGLNLNDKATEAGIIEEPLKIGVSRERILEEAKHLLDAENQDGKKGISIVVIGKSIFFSEMPNPYYDCDVS